MGPETSLLSYVSWKTSEFSSPGHVHHFSLSLEDTPPIVAKCLEKQVYLLSGIEDVAPH